MVEALEMKIQVSSIPEEGLKEHAVYDPAALDMEREDIRPAGPFDVDAQINLVDKELVVSAEIHCAVRMTCARCLEAFESPVSPRAIFSYSVEPGDIVDITEDVRQEIILAYPMVPVCRPECKGLCAACGQNLNERDCGHPQPSSSPAEEPRGGGSIAI